MAAGGNKKVFDDINITPLTDIFLVLLVIMMVVAPMLTFKELSVSFSPADETAESTPDEPKPGQVLINIDENGDFMLNEEIVPLENLLEHLKTAAKEEEPSLTVETNPASPFSSMAKAMDLAQQAGITQVSVVEGPGEASEEPSS